MSYCRCNGEDSEVYAYPGYGGGFVIWLSGNIELPKNFPNKNYFVSRMDLLNYLASLKEIGVKVPDYALDKISDEIEKFGITGWKTKEEEDELTEWICNEQEE